MCTFDIMSKRIKGPSPDWPLMQKRKVARFAETPGRESRKRPVELLRLPSLGGLCAATKGGTADFANNADGHKSSSAYIRVIRG